MLPSTPYLLLKPANVVAAAGGGLDSATTAWVAAVVAAGGTVSGGQQTNVDTLIKAYKSASIFTLLDREWLYASENTFQAKIDIINLGTHTVHGSPTFTASQGYTGTSNIADFIDTGYASGTNFTKNANSFGGYVRTSRTTGNSNDMAMGNGDASGSVNRFVSLNVSNNLQFDDCNGAFPSIANANAQGSYLFSRTSSTNIDVYKNAASIGPAASTTFTFPATNFYGLAWNNNGTAQNATGDQMAAIFMGGALNSTQAAAKNSALNAYMTSLGTNVY